MPGVPSLTAFSALSPPWSLVSLDANFTAISALLKSANNYSLYLADSGAANAYAVSFGAGISVSLAAGLQVSFKAANANTAASTLNVNGTGAKSLKMQDGSDPAAGDIPAGGVITATYDGTNYIITGINVANFARLTGATFTGAITVASGTITTSQPAINVTQTWNAGGVTFVGKDTNITSTASAAASLIEQWRVGGSVMASIRKDGLLTLAGNITSAGTSISFSGGSTTFAISSGNIFFNTAGGTQFAINNTASVTNAITVTGSNGGNPSISSSGGNLQINSATSIIKLNGAVMINGNNAAAAPGISVTGNSSSQGGGMTCYDSSNTLLTSIYSGISTAAAGVGDDIWYKSAPASQKIFVENRSGGVSLSDGATAWAAVSDERLKVLGEPITGASVKVASLRTVMGRYKSDNDTVRRPFLIAQDVDKVLPEAVDKSRPDEWDLRYTDVIPLVVAAVNEHTQRIVALETK